MTDARLAEIEEANDWFDMNAPDDVQDLIDAYRALRADHAALRAAVVQALGRVGNLRVICPELAEAVEPKGGES